jgi:hypothetical protein
MLLNLQEETTLSSSCSHLIMRPKQNTGKQINKKERFVMQDGK